MSATLCIVVDSMSMASWFVLHTFISVERPTLRLGLIPVLFFMVVRTAVNLLGLIISSKVLNDLRQVGGGIFFHVFSGVLSLSENIGDNIFLSHQPLWTAFEGRGIRLGGGELLARFSRSQSS